MKPAPGFVRERLEQAYASRNPAMLSRALVLALAAPDRSFTPLLCDIALEEQWLQGCQEMALEVLIDLADPASFDPLLSLCTRPALKLGDGNDWRKAVFAITVLPVERSKIEQALRTIAGCGNDLAEEAAHLLKFLKR
ncbi:MAG TPA: hypothetical protein VF211_02270 [Burkholderiales bacterium]